jgi:hypothetical protein
MKTRVCFLLLIVFATLAVQFTPTHTANSSAIATLRDGNGPVPPWRDGNGPVPPWRDGNGPVPPWHDGNGPVPPWQARG